MSISFWLLLTLFLLIGVSSLTALTNALKRMYKKETKKPWKILGSSFFYLPIHHLFFPQHQLKGLFFACYAAQSWIRLAYGASLGLFAFAIFEELQHPFPIVAELTLVVILFFISYLLADFLPKTIGVRHPEKVTQSVGLITSVFLTLSLPLLLLFLLFFGRMHIVRDALKERISDMPPDILDDVSEGESLLPEEKKIFQSIVSFRDRVAREVMVPRIDTFCLPSTTTIKEAATLLLKEGYSRTPVYRQTVDEIIGILMFKDIFAKYMEYQETLDVNILNTPIETLLKPVLYTPETKKISALLQEFRKKQMHLAVVVDEYGGTEGVVSIEDILEEIVGEIADEYDEETSHFIQTSDGSFIVDARMSIYDIKENLGIDIPDDGDYDTIGGYLFALTASIPPNGYRVLLEDCSLEVLSSSPRNIGKIRIEKRRS